MSSKIIQKETLYIQIKQQILREIIAKRWPVGGVMPNEFALADEYKVSQGTVRKALNILTAENVLVRRQGKGTYVSASGATRFFKFQTTAGKTEITSSQRLSVQKISTPNFIKKYFNAKNKYCFKIERLRIFEQDAKLYEVLYLPYELFPDFEKEPALNRFLYQYYEAKNNIPINRAEQTVKSILADKNCQKYLNVAKQSPVLLQQHIVYDLKDNVIEYRQAFCDSDKLLYKVVLN